VDRGNGGVVCAAAYDKDSSAERRRRNGQELWIAGR
jgi:hypothetical protein